MDETASQDKKAAAGLAAAPELFKIYSSGSKLYNVCSLHSASAFCQIISDLLTLFKSLEAFALDSGEMYEYVISVFTSDEPITFFCVEPLNSTFVHFVASI